MPLNEKGQEIPDPTPIAINIRQRKIQKFDDVRAFIRRELSEAASRGGMESIEEANDFDIDDDPVDPTTPWEEWGDRQAEIDRQIEAERKADREFARRKKAKQPPQDQPQDPEGMAPSGTPAPPTKPIASQPPPGKPGAVDPT